MLQKKKCTKCGKLKSINSFVLQKTTKVLSRRCRLCKETKKCSQTGLVNLKIELKESDYHSIRDKAANMGFSVKNYILRLHQQKNMQKK